MKKDKKNKIKQGDLIELYYADGLDMGIVIEVNKRYKDKEYLYYSFTQKDAVWSNGAKASLKLQEHKVKELLFTQVMIGIK